MDFLTTLLVAIFFFLMGAIIVGFIWYLQGLTHRTQKTLDVAAPEDPDLEEIVHLMRHKQNQELVVQIGGKNYSTFEQLSPGQQRRIVFTSNVLCKWLGDAPPAEPKEALENSAEPPLGPEDLLLSETMGDEASQSSIPPFVSEPVEPVKPVSTELPDVMGGILKPASQPKPAFKSIAMQINDVLQSHLAGTEMAARGITLQDSPDRGVMVTLDGKQYGSVMDVPDEEVRNIIRDAVVEWETKK